MNMRISNVSFGGWKCSKELIGKLNNEKELDKLANTANIDTLSTNKSKDSKYFPSSNLYTTTAFKKLNNKCYFGFDCVILPKDTSQEKLSEKIFESSEKAIGKLLGRIALDDKADPAKINIFQEVIKFFKKGITK